jgi:hypothetical protein
MKKMVETGKAGVHTGTWQLLITLFSIIMYVILLTFKALCQYELQQHSGHKYTIMHKGQKCESVLSS